MTAVSDPARPVGDENLTEPERRLVSCVATGAVLDLRPADGGSDDPASGLGWDAGRTIRAEVLAGLVTGDRLPPEGRLRAVKLRGARISGQLDLESCKIICPVLLRECWFDKLINLAEAEAVSIRFPGCHLPALLASQLRTTGNVELNQGFTARGEARLQGAHIGGRLDFSGARLDPGTRRALKADGLIVEQDMLCRSGFTARGEVRLPGAHIRGQLDFSGASLDARGGLALTADGLTVDQDMFCRDGFSARGEVSLLGTHIDGQLSFSGANLDSQTGKALSADGLTVGLGMMCRGGFTARGEVRLPGAQVGGELDFSGAVLINAAQVALDLEDVTCGSLLLPVRKPVGGIDLSRAKTDHLVDNEGGWPDVLILAGFVYGRMENDRIGYRARLRWLRLQPGRYIPQPYDQLADCYRRAGHEATVRNVLVAKQLRRRRTYSPLTWLWYVTVGFGYRTWQILIWLAGLVIVGNMVFSRAYPAHMVMVTAHPQAFQPVVYALDVLLPVVGLGQKASWQPTGGYLDWYWALTVAGWVLASAVVTGLGGVLKRS